jgi:hypothetical protein
MNLDFEWNLLERLRTKEALSLNHYIADSVPPEPIPLEMKPFRLYLSSCPDFPPDLYKELVSEISLSMLSSLVLSFI